MIIKNGVPITTLTEWENRAGPKRRIQWKDGRSAKEAARAWLSVTSPNLPEEIRGLLATSSACGPLVAWSAEPEAPVRFDEFGGEPANVDLLVVGEDQAGVLVMAVEAKADESFGAEIRDTLASALERRLKSKASMGLERVEQLAAQLLPPRDARRGGSPLGRLRYQLLTASAAALAEAGRRGASRAVLAVHEFVTEETQDRNHRRNARDLQQFLRWTTQDPEFELAEGQLYGPIRAPGAGNVDGTWAGVELFVGKAVRRMRALPQ